MADELRRRTENVGFLQDVVNRVLTSYERYEFINILNDFQQKREIDVFVLSLRQLLNTPGKQELIPYLLCVLSIREREHFLQLWMRTSNFKVYYAEGNSEKNTRYLMPSQFLEDQYSSIHSVKSLPADTRVVAAKTIDPIAWRSRRLNLLRAERDRLELLAEGRPGKRPISTTATPRNRHGNPRHRINGVDERPPVLMQLDPYVHKARNVGLLKGRRGNFHPQQMIKYLGSDDGTVTQLTPLRRDEGNKSNRHHIQKFGVLPTRTVYLSRDKQTNGFGLSIRGGMDNGQGTFVSAIEKGSPAEEMGLYIGDQILSVNGCSLAHTSHSEIVQMILQSRQLKLEIFSECKRHEFQENYQWLDPSGRPCSPPVEFRRSHRINGELHKSYMRLLVDDDERKVNLIMDGSNKIGLIIRGGKEYGLGIYVAGVDKESVAERAGLTVGDQILDINGTSFLSITHAEAASLIKSQRMMTVTLRDVGKVPYASSVFNKPALRTIEKKPRDPLDSSRWDEEHEMEPGSAIFRQGIAGSQLMHQSVVGVTAHGLIQDQGRLVLTESELESLRYYLKQYGDKHVDIHDLVLALLRILDTTPKMALLSDIRSAIHPHDIDVFDEMVLKKELAAHKHRQKISPVPLHNGHDLNGTVEHPQVFSNQNRKPVKEEDVRQYKEATVQTDDTLESIGLNAYTLANGLPIAVDTEHVSSKNSKISADGIQGSSDRNIVYDHPRSIMKKPSTVLAKEADSLTCKTFVDVESDIEEDLQQLNKGERERKYRSKDNYSSDDENDEIYGIAKPVEIQINHENMEGGGSVAVINESAIKSEITPEERSSPEPKQAVPILQNGNLVDNENESFIQEEMTTLYEFKHDEKSSDLLNTARIEPHESHNADNELPYTDHNLELVETTPTGLDHLRMALSRACSDCDSDEHTHDEQTTPTLDKFGTKPHNENDFIVSEDVAKELKVSQNEPEPGRNFSKGDANSNEGDSHEEIGPSLFLDSSMTQQTINNVDREEIIEVKETEINTKQNQSQKPLFFVPFGFKSESGKVPLADMMVSNFDTQRENVNSYPSMLEKQFQPSSTTVLTAPKPHIKSSSNQNQNSPTHSRPSSGKRQLQDVVDVSNDIINDSVVGSNEERPYSTNPAFSNIMRIPKDYTSKETEKSGATSHSNVTHNGPLPLGYHSFDQYSDLNVNKAVPVADDHYKTIRNFTWNASVTTTYDPEHGIVPMFHSHPRPNVDIPVKEIAISNDTDSTLHITSQTLDRITENNSPSTAKDRITLQTDLPAEKLEVSVKKIKELFESKSKELDSTKDRIRKLVRTESLDTTENTNGIDVHLKTKTKFEFRPNSDSTTTSNTSFLSQSSIQDLDLTSYSGVGADTNDTDPVPLEVSRKHSQGHVIKIDKSYSQLGLVLEGGLHNDIKILKVKSIQKNKFSAAYAATEENGLLREGQEILAVDGESLEGLSHSIANLVIRQAYNNPDGRYLELMVKDI